jgi:hypothetical protein
MEKPAHDRENRSEEADQMMITIGILLAVFAFASVYMNVFENDHGFPETRKRNFWRSIWK